MSYLVRYQAGERREVWDDLLKLGAGVCQEPVFSDAMAVARETMKRVRHNVELLHQRLVALDYRFAEPENAHVPPGKDVHDKIRELEKIAGSLPLSLMAWFEIVGRVDFRGHHPTLAAFHPHLNAEPYPYYSDPLFFWNVEAALHLTAEDPAQLDIPDWFHKSNISGATYSIALPNPAADCEIEYEPHETTFVNYLQIAFEWGGFPGFHLHTDARFETWRQEWNIPKTYPDFPIPYDELKALSEGLLSV